MSETRDPEAATHSNSGQEPILVASHVYKHFDGIQAVNDCSIEVVKNTITGLIGPNGAGKTTLFNVISGFYRPDDGEVHFNGRRIDGLPAHEISQRGLSRTFQITRELKQMTVLENLMLVPKNQRGENLLYTWFSPGQVRQQEREIKEKALEVLEFVDLIHLRDEYAMNLSVGQKRLLELARTMMADPDVLLLDEPAAGVNPTLMKRLVGYIRSLAEELDVTVFLIEHDMNVVMNICNPVIVMSRGTKLAEGTPDEIRENREVLDAYLGSQYR